LIVLLATGASPAWSPDGSKIAFVWDGSIWIMNSDETDQRRLTNHPRDEFNPTWSPDGSKRALLLKSRV